MVIDDEPDILKLVETGLKKYGHDVDTFSEPVKALTHFGQYHNDYALLIIDIRMPGMSGIEFVRNARQIAPDVKFLLMTAFEMTAQEIQKDLQFFGTDNLLKKPFMLSSICKVVEKHLVNEM